LTGALRWDAVEDGGFGVDPAEAIDPQRAWSPRVAVALRLTDAGSVSMFGHVSRAFKAPTLDQRFDPRPYPDFQGGTFTISNPRLVPQRATNAEAGISGAGPVRWSALAYHMAVEDEIDFDLRTFSYANIGESRHTGFEVEAEGQWGNRVRPSITYALARVQTAGGEHQLRNVPRHLVTLGLGADLPWRIGALARYARTWSAYLDDQNLLGIDGPSTLDVRFRRPVGRHAVFVDVLNATNDTYEEYGFVLGDFLGGTVPYAYPGAPRAARVGFTVSY
jgi:outer membrane receptor protein involved in Fe transport